MIAVCPVTGGKLGIIPTGANMDKKILDKVQEAVHDGENIAKSAMSLTINRSQDLRINPVLTITILKVICEIAIEDYRAHFTDNHPLGSIEKEIGIFGEVEKMVDRAIRQEFRETKAKATGG